MNLTEDEKSSRKQFVKFRTRLVITCEGEYPDQSKSLDKFHLEIQILHQEHSTDKNDK